MTIIYSGLQPIDRSCFDADLIRKNIEAFNKGSFPAPMDASHFNSRATAGTSVLVVCPGPSYREELPSGQTRLENLLENKGDADVILGGSAAGLMASGKIAPEHVDGIVFSNPESEYMNGLPDSSQLQNIPIYVATHCLPEVFEALKERDANIMPWNAYLDHMPGQFNTEEYAVGVGYGAAVSTISLMSAIGHKHFDVVGWDGSPFYDPEHDTSEWAQDREEKSYPVTVDGKDFVVHGLFADDVPEFVSLVQKHKDAVRSLLVHGDESYNAALLNDNGGMRFDFSRFEF